MRPHIYQPSRRVTAHEVKMELKQIKKKYRREQHALYLEYRARMGELTRQYREDVEDYYITSGKPRPKDPPKRPVLEEIGNAVTHGVGAILAVIAYVFMCLYSADAMELAGATIYFVGLFVMFTVSCLYHSFRHGTAVKRLFRRFDYSSIYLLIGATFAPILLCYIKGVFGVSFFVIQWLIIATGISLVGVFGPSRLRFIHIPLYLILGWCGLMFLPNMIANGDYAFLGFILGGGVVYSIGIIPFVLKRGPAHFIWHFFVLAGAVVQWVGVFTCIYLP